ncbi:MAG: hypothetical protein SGJ13_06055 [Actinomycetota bacterium]|nr:hypothetical protein [Actinomycetota bacterium]
MLVPLTPTVADASAEPNDTESAIATYNGNAIRLAESWEGAHACAVLTETDIRCFDTENEMHDALKAAAQKDTESWPASSALSCGVSEVAILYDGVGFSGDILAFQTTFLWANLANFGFDNRMESWVNNRYCDAKVADGTGGTGGQLTLSARSNSPTVGAWKNIASSEYVP